MEYAEYKDWYGNHLKVDQADDGKYYVFIKKKRCRTWYPDSLPYNWWRDAEKELFYRAVPRKR